MCRVGVAHGVRKKSHLPKQPPTRPAFGRPPSPRGGGIGSVHRLAKTSLSCKRARLKSPHRQTVTPRRGLPRKARRRSGSSPCRGGCPQGSVYAVLTAV